MPVNVMHGTKTSHMVRRWPCSLSPAEDVDIREKACRGPQRKKKEKNRRRDSDCLLCSTHRILFTYPGPSTLLRWSKIPEAWWTCVMRNHNQDTWTFDSCCIGRGLRSSESLPPCRPQILSAVNSWRQTEASSAAGLHPILLKLVYNIRSNSNSLRVFLYLYKKNTLQQHL
jgi:hypothetical protein